MAKVRCSIDIESSYVVEVDVDDSKWKGDDTDDTVIDDIRDEARVKGLALLREDLEAGTVQTFTEVL